MTSALRQGLALAQQQDAARPDIDQESQFTKGLRAGTWGMGASLNQLAGGVAEVAGANDFAQGRYQAADELNRDAGLRGPRIASFEQLGKEGYSLRNMGDYAAGVIGQSVPSMLPAVAAGALTPAAWGLRGALAVGTAAYAPMETGEVVGRMREQSGNAPITGGDLAQAAGTGLLSSAVQTVPGAIVGGKIAGKAAGDVLGKAKPGMTLKQAVTHNLWEAPAEGLSEVAGTAVKQLGSGQGLDGNELLEAGIAGTIGGGALSGAGTVADYARSNAAQVGESAQNLYQGAKDRLGGAQNTLSEGVKTVQGVIPDAAWDKVAEFGKNAWAGVTESDLGKTLKERADNTRQRISDILSDPDTPANIKAALQERMNSVGDRATQMYAAAVDLTRKGIKATRDKEARAEFVDEARGVVDKILNGESLADAKRMATATTEQAQQMMSEAATKAADFSRRMGEDILRRANISPELKAQVEDFMQNTGDAAKQAWVAAKWKALDGLDTLREKAKGLADRVRAMRKGGQESSDTVDGETRWVDDPAPGLGNGQRRLGNSKRSEDYSGIRSVIAGALRPYAKRINTELANRPEDLNTLADGLRTYIESVVDTSGDYDSMDRGWARAQVASILGDDAAGLLADVAEKIGVGQNRQQAEAFYTELAELESLQRSQRGLRDVIARARSDISDRQANALIESAMAWASGEKYRGKTPTQAEVQFDNQRMQSEIENALGPKSKVFMRELEKMVSRKSDMAMPNPNDKSLDDQAQVEEFANGMKTQDDAPTRQYMGGGKDKRTPVVDPALARAKNPEYESDTEKRIKQIQAENPGSDVRFVSLKQRPELIERIPAEKRALTLKAKELEAQMPGAENAEARQAELEKYRASRLRDLQNEGRGFVEVSQMRDGDKLTMDDVDSMRMDTEKYGGKEAKGRLEVRDAEGNVTDVFDAVKMTRQMVARINAERTWTKGDDLTDTTRLGRAFSDAMAALYSQVGKVRAPQGQSLADVVIGTVAGKPVTAFEALKFDKRTGSDTKVDATHAELNDLRAKYKASTNPEVRDAILKRAKGLMNKLDFRRDSDLTKEQMDENEVSLTEAAEGKQDPDPQGNISIAAARMGEEGAVQRVNVDGSPKSAEADAKVAGPHEAKNAKRLIAHAYEVEEMAGGMAASNIRKRLVMLANNIGMMTEADQRQLMTALSARQPSAIAEIINPLARKYADRIVPPKGSAPAEPDRGPKKAVPDQRTEAVARNGAYGEKAMTVEQLQAEIARTEAADRETARAIGAADKDLATIRRLDPKATASDGMWRTENPKLKALRRELATRGETPDPKAVAAKKAAFLEKAASGDKGLIDELSASTDVKGLQRALDALLDEVATEGSAKVIDAVLARLTTLLQNPDAQYAATTAKYSREKTAAAPQIVDVGNGEQGVISRIGPIGPVQSGMLATAAEDGVYKMFLIKDGQTEVDGPVLQFEAWQREDGKWEIGIDGPQPGTKNFDSMADLFDYSEGPDPYGDGTVGYSKFHDGVFSTGETRQLLRTFRDHLSALGINPEVITRGRDTGERAGRPYTDFDKEFIRKFSRERVGPTQIDGRTEPINGKEILDYIETVLGDSVRVEFAGILHSGDFTRTDIEDLIRISVHSLDPMSVAYHESLHAFFQKLRDKGLGDIANVVMRAVQTPAVMKQLRERLAHSPEALEQLKDPEERAAYAFQFSMSDPTFKLNPEPRTAFEKIAAAFRKLLGIWTDSDRALHIMDYFATGQFKTHMASRNYAAVHLTTMGPGRNQALQNLKAMGQPLARLADALIGAGSARLRDSGIPALRELADTIKRDMTTTGRDAGYIPAARLARTHYLNKLVLGLKDVDPAKLHNALEGLQTETEADSPEGRLAQRQVKAYLRELHGYMRKAGVDVGDLGENYFPRVWDTNAISKNQDAFVTMLQSYGLDESVMHTILNGNDPSFETERPGNQHTRERKLRQIRAADASPFLRKDFWETLEVYTTQATRRAEWSRRFGAKNEGLDALYEQAVDEGATPEQIETAKEYIKGVNGTLGDDLDPSARRLMGNLLVYQNLRLLPMAIFSSVVDPMGVLVRGGTIGDAWETLKRGVKELPKSWQKDPKFDGAHMLAETLGVIDDATMSSVMSTQYTQGLVDGTARKINDAFFKYNFMEGFNRSMRVGASQAAIKFIQRHLTNPNQHSQRYLQELGLRPGDVVIRDGKVLVTQADGLSPQQAASMRRAVNLWVDGAVLRPDQADRPIWMNDPHFMLLSHLKSFVFAFHHTILKRVLHEVKEGNYTPAMALAGYVPMMLAADLTKDLLTNGGDEPEWKRNWTAADHLGYAVQRAGILGVGQFGVDAIGDVQRGGMGIGALAGPTVDQLTDAIQVMGGSREFAPFVLRSMPANSLYRDYVKDSEQETVTPE